MNQWAKMMEKFDLWGSPLRPSPADVEMFAGRLTVESHTLLLGVTTELMDLAEVAVDNNPAVQGDKVVLGDWGYLPFDSQFDAIIGDGALNAFQGSPEHFFGQMQKALKPGGRLILRVFLSPEEKETVAAALYSQNRSNFHAYKWRVAHALANPYVRVQDLFDTIKPIYPHPTLDIYDRSPLIYYFPKLSELPPWEHVQFTRSYELADRCPVITWKFH